MIAALLLVLVVVAYGVFWFSIRPWFRARRETRERIARLNPPPGSIEHVQILEHEQLEPRAVTQWNHTEACPYCADQRRVGAMSTTYKEHL